MSDQFPRSPADEEREALEALAADIESGEWRAQGFYAITSADGLARDLRAVLARWPQTPDHSGDVTDMVPAVEISEALAHLDEIGHALRAEGRGHRLESVAATLRRLAGKAPAGTLRGVVGHRFQDGTMIVSIEGTCTVGREGTRSLYVRADELRAEVGQRVTIRIEVDNG